MPYLEQVVSPSHTKLRCTLYELVHQLATQVGAPDEGQQRNRAQRRLERSRDHGGLLATSDPVVDCHARWRMLLSARIEKFSPSPPTEPVIQSAVEQANVLGLLVVILRNNALLDDPLVGRTLPCINLPHFVRSGDRGRHGEQYSRCIRVERNRGESRNGRYEACEDRG